MDEMTGREKRGENPRKRRSCTNQSCNNRYSKYCVGMGNTTIVTFLPAGNNSFWGYNGCTLAGRSFHIGVGIVEPPEAFPIWKRYSIYCNISSNESYFWVHGNNTGFPGTSPAIHHQYCRWVSYLSLLSAPPPPPPPAPPLKPLPNVPPPSPAFPGCY